MIKVYAVGGYNEVGKNMTCIEVDNEAIILDMGLYMDRFVALQEKNAKMNEKILLAEDAIPNDAVIDKLKEKVKAIVISHAHLDHIGAIKWMAKKYNVPVISTPYTAEIIKKHYDGEIIKTNVNSSYSISKNLKVEFINVTHSVPQSSILNIQTKYGSVLYGLDYKNDIHPVLGKKTNIKKLKSIDNVILLIADSTNADEEKKTFSEQIAKEMIKDIMTGMENEEHAIFVTTFSSHIARLSTIKKMSKMIGRKVVFIGRSLKEYIEAAQKLKLIKFDDAEIIGNISRAKEKIREIVRNRNEYVFVVTGGMGEKNAVLTRIVNNETDIKIERGDFVIFSCNVIPTPVIQANRKILEQKLQRKGARIFKDIHVSGHASREDLRDLIKITSPQNIIPAHGDISKTASMAALAAEMGYELGKNVYLLQNGQDIEIKL